MGTSAARALVNGSDCGDVIHTPSAIGNVERVCPAPSAKILCDWYQGTMPASLMDAVVEEVSRVFGSSLESKTIPSGMRAYKNAMEFSAGVTLYYENRYTKTCCLVLTGKSAPTDHFGLISKLYHLGVRATRIDLAFDDRRSVLSISDIYTATRSDNLVSRWKASRWEERVKNRSGARVGQGVVIGSKTSAAYLSIYDKGLESESAPEGDWVRWELRLADQEAQKFAEDFFADNPYATEDDLNQHLQKAQATQDILCYDTSGMAIFVKEIPPNLVTRFKVLALAALKERLSFRDRTSSINVSRAAVLPWWHAILEYFDPTIESKVSFRDMDYEELSRRHREKTNKENYAFRRADEILAEVYDEHICPNAKGYVRSLLLRIPDWDDPIPRENPKDTDHKALELAGPSLRAKCIIIQFPLARCRCPSPIAGDEEPQLAEVICLAQKRAVRFRRASR